MFSGGLICGHVCWWSNVWTCLEVVYYVHTSTSGVISSQSHNKGVVFRAYSDDHLTDCRRHTTVPERSQQSRGSTATTCTISPTKPPSSYVPQYHRYVLTRVPRDRWRHCGDLGSSRFAMMSNHRLSYTGLCV